MKYLFAALWLLISIAAHCQPQPAVAEIWVDGADTTLTDLWVDSVHRVKVHIDNRKELIGFSVLNKGKWVNAGTYKTTIRNVDVVRTQDLNGDGMDEIMASTGRNMNGNQWMDVFSFVPATNTICYSGALNTDYKIDIAHKAIQVTYTGSWYMDIYKKLYVWHGYKLVPERMMLIKLKHERPDCDSVYVTWYDRASAGGGSLKRTAKRQYPVDDKRLEDIWDHFFDQQTK